MARSWWLPLLLGLAATSSLGPYSSDDDPTYFGDIQPILARSCVPCHSPGGESPFSLSTSVLGSLFFVYLTSTVVTPIAGRYIDRLGHRIVLVFGMACGALGALLTLVPNVIVIIIGLALVCNAVFVSQTCGNSFIGVATKTNRALAVGLYVMVYNIGGSMGAAVPGAIWKSYGWVGVVTLIVAVQILTMILAWNLWPARKPAAA